ncbi:potassium-transporting ATPase subunit KdpC [Phaeovulum sp. W22_SRMD_FR3]|uniref:potassium-transporting ATPase subunit KdpC n=1 Tax=Phaeovulum sp. W22_SRMD_FR3 TaxID=3240274 RepID=UPI003F9BB22E
MLTHLRPAVTLLAAMTLLTGLAYPLAMTGLAQALVPQTANGGLIAREGRVIGAALIAQGFTTPGYLHPRPSAVGYNAMPSGASNLGATSATLAAEIATRRAAWEAENGATAPVDAVTASASGLDPDISPENARLQASRIAAARGAPPEAVLAIIAAHTEGRWLGLFGAPRVNVLVTNLALDAALPLPLADGS